MKAIFSPKTEAGRHARPIFLGTFFLQVGFTKL
jgi:hypothetical protein